MRIVMIMKLKILGHGYEADGSHPRAPKVTSLGGCLSSLQKKNHCLHCAKPRYVLEALFVFYALSVNVDRCEGHLRALTGR
jgi:hypothetical protein